MRTKRTRPIRGTYWNETPRMVHEGRIISIRSKISQVQLIDHGPAKQRGRVGEIERGSVDGEE